MLLGEVWSCPEGEGGGGGGGEVALEINSGLVFILLLSVHFYLQHLDILSGVYLGGAGIHPPCVNLAPPPLKYF